jgi:ferric-dicitrate binding protein FerR (iron transport regulator)
MIEPQNDQRGVIGQQHGLQRLTETLERLETGQREHQARDRQLMHALDLLTAIPAQQAQTHAALQRLTLWSQGVLAGLLVVALLSVGGTLWLWWQTTHLAMVQMIEPQAPAPRPPGPGRK